MVKPGYKQTEIGVIPENWEVGAIGSVCTSVAVGGNYQNSATPSDYPLIKMGNLSRGNITLEKVEYIKATIPDQKDLLHYGDVLFNTRNTPELVGKVAIWRNELPKAYYNSNLLRFVFDTEKADPFFMNLALNTKETVSAFRNIAKGTTSVAAIYPQDLLKVIIPIPPLAEQQRIAEALSDMDELIASLEKLISKKKAIKQGAMQELLTGKRRLPGFSGEWKQYLLGDVLTVGHGQSQHGIENPAGKYPILATGGIVGRTNHFLCSEPSVLIGRKGTIDKPQYMDTPFWTIDTLFFTKIKRGFVPRYVYYVFCLIPWADYNEASGVPSLSATVIESIKVTMPEFEEQIAIQTVLSEIDCELKSLEQKLVKTRQIKQGMMQQLLTGKIRLN